jgi:hypothetical protein
MKGVTLALGILLGVLWLVGLSQGATPWLVWWDLVAAVITIVLAVTLVRSVGQFSNLDGAVGVGLLVLWIIALNARATTWLVWSTFVFGIAYLIAASSMVGHVGRRTVGRPSHA